MDKQVTRTGSSGTFSSICLFCSAGCSIQLQNDNHHISGISGTGGLINPGGFICHRPLSGYGLLNRGDRLTVPLLRNGDGFEPVSWERAFQLIEERLRSGDPDKTAFFAGARLTNEELYLIQKLARAGVRTNNIGSFHYLGRGTSYTRLSRANLPFAELTESKTAWIFGKSLFRNHPLPAGIINNYRESGKLSINLVTTDREAADRDFAGQTLLVGSFYHFVRAVNHYLASNNLENKDFIRDLTGNYSDYREKLLSEDPGELLSLAGIDDHATIAAFAVEYLQDKKAVLIFSESEMSGHTCAELFNLACITGKHGKDGSGLMLLKESCNSHGLHDMGVFPNLGPGATEWQDPFLRSTFEYNWKAEGLPADEACLFSRLKEQHFRQLYIFGEDPAGCAVDQPEMLRLLSGLDFLVVQDHFLTATARLANLVLPATTPFETGGTITNTQRVIQKVSRIGGSGIAFASWQQADRLLSAFGYPPFESVDDVTMEIVSLLPKFCTSSKLSLRITEGDNENQLFRHGCDHLAMLVNEQG